MKTVHTRFGPVAYDPEKTIYFAQGMVGFEHLHHYVLVPTEENDFLTCLQSVEDGSIAFLFVDPTRYFSEYTYNLTAYDRSALQISDQGEVIILTTITVHQDQSITLNLAAPVIISPENNRAIQVVLENTSYSSRQPLPTQPSS